MLCSDTEIGSLNKKNASQRNSAVEQQFIKCLPYATHWPKVVIKMEFLL